ncbi:hypothetical protein Clacol_003280 [Clathrus columnatus]|uniref:Amidohydrolase-related domain-containing protein n=1 Tax=Clathrus columnatus TaxID=1419009 RepID=A0AAV5A8T7_9AGAM|nr:hypothetical protein Clacol_003280 [Clathrus columnatus]
MEKERLLSSSSLPIEDCKPKTKRDENKWGDWLAVTASILIWLIICLAIYSMVSSLEQFLAPVSKGERKLILQRCASMRTLPTGFDASKRTESDRFDPGTNSTLLRNAKIWTGSLNGTEIIYGDVLLHNGIVKALGYIPSKVLGSIKPDALNVHDLQGAWVTPGLVDLHSHIGVGSAPDLKGASDTNSHNGPILSWLRSIDGLNTHDDSYRLSIAGGVTTAQVLPGSGNNIGGQSFVIKLRSTPERSVISKLVEPPPTLNGTEYAYTHPQKWRHMKHACGENPSRSYDATRMDSIWAFRQAYNEARIIKESQDKYCEVAEKGDWKMLSDMKWSESLQWEALVDVLRGKVKITNEFKFPVASFHHAGSAYLVPDLLKKTYGGAPAIALFSSNFRKKREAYRGSEFGPRTLADDGIRVVMKSDHFVINSRYLLNEAAVAFYYGLPANLALSSVTTVPAEAAGLGHRVGRIRPGYDADVVIWDSHPLSLGATPTQVYIDGIPQLENAVVSFKPPTFQDVPKTPNFDIEASDAVRYEGLPPLMPKAAGVENILFVNVSQLWSVHGSDIVPQIVASNSTSSSVLVHQGKILCISTDDTNPFACASRVKGDSRVVHLDGGMIAPALTTFGTEVGVSEIRLEASTNDGGVIDPLTDTVPSILGDDPTVRAVDGLLFQGRNTLLAYRGGVTTAIVPPTGSAFWKGLSTAFNTGSTSSLQPGAIIKDVVALHTEIGKGHRVSVSTEIATLRKLLLEGDKETAFTSVSKGELPLVIHVHNADIMATLIRLKQEVEVFAGATEAWMIASDIAQANINVILSPSKSFPETWDRRRILPGPPLSYDTPLTVLLDHNVTVAIGVENGYEARHTRFDMAWAALESNDRIDRVDAYAIASTNFEKIFGFTISPENREYVAWKGGDVFDMSSKAVAIFSSSRGSSIIIKSIYDDMTAVTMHARVDQFGELFPIGVMGPPHQTARTA